MSEHTKKLEEKVAQIEQEAKETELPEQDLDKVAGGGVCTNPAHYHDGTKSNVKTS